MLRGTLGAFIRGGLDTATQAIQQVNVSDEEKIVNEEDKLNLSVTKDKFNNRIRNIKNDKIKKSLMELTKIFREK